MADVESATRALAAVEAALRQSSPLAVQLTQKITPAKAGVHMLAGDTVLGSAAVNDLQFAQEAAGSCLVYLADAQSKLQRLVGQLRNV